MSDELQVAVFASGGGSNFQSLIDKKEEGKLHVTFALLLGNNSKAKAFERARNHDIPTLHIAPSHFEDEKKYTKKLLEELESRNIGLIVLAGYMKMIPAEVIEKYHNRIINIHPALLPSFGGQGMYGKKVHQAVLDYGAKVSGITVHFVNRDYDKGPIILQETAPVLDGDDADSLAARVLKIEHANYWRAVEAFSQGTIKMEGRRFIGSA
jgi:phosphoribosylglycinamide formyltransferase-1